MRLLLVKATTAVLQNKTWGENLPHGQGNSAASFSQTHVILKSLTPQSTFANDDLIDTVGMRRNTYNVNSTSTDAVGSVSLTNSTAETFIQDKTNTSHSEVLNCFSCHVPNSNGFRDLPLLELPNFMIALIRVLAPRLAVHRPELDQRSRVAGRYAHVQVTTGPDPRPATPRS